MQAMEQPLEASQADIDAFLGRNGGVMRYHHINFLSNEEAKKKDGWLGIYYSLQAQIKRIGDHISKPDLEEQKRLEWRGILQNIIMDLCHITIFYKERIHKDDMRAIIQQIHFLRFIHPIGEAHIEADLVFKEKLVRAIVTIAKQLE